jgi:hypothetical protein
VSSGRDDSAFRFPVQYVIRPDLDFRGFAGQIASGTVRRGDTVLVQPSGRSSRVKSIVTWDGELEEAFAPMSVTVCLEDEIDISRGDMLVAPDDPPHSGRRFEATLVWMNAQPLQANRPYLLKHTTQTVQSRIREVRHRIDVNTLKGQAAGALALNEIGIVSVEANRALFFDSYRENRFTGSFILIDPISNETLGAGMIGQAEDGRSAKGRVTASDREAAFGHAALAICLPNGSEELAYALERDLFDHGYGAVVVEPIEAVVKALTSGGMIAILWAGADLVRGFLPRDRVVVIESAESATQMRHDLVAGGKLGIRQSRYIDGEGI